MARIAHAHRRPGEAQRDATEEQDHREEHGDVDVVVGVLGRGLPLLEPHVAELLQRVGFHRVPQHVVLLEQRARGRVHVVLGVLGQPAFERGPELVTEAPLVEVGEPGVAVGGDLEPAVEVEEVLGAVLRGQRRCAIGQSARRARLRVPTRLEPAPLRGLVPAPRDAERRQRERSAAAISSHRSRVDVDSRGSTSSWGAWT